ncbi:MAG: hypothetical protein RJA70_2455 [Pseudomonadota bacterium]
MEALLLDEQGTEVHRERVVTPRGDYLGIVDTLTDLVKRVKGRAGTACSVGVGIPGIVSTATGLVKNANSTELNGNPLDRDLEARLDQAVRIENDANCFALSEAVDGAAADLNIPGAVVFGVILGTGVGGGLVVGRQLVRGPDGITGEWGHTQLPWRTPDETPGPECWCGLNSCVETYLSGPGLARDYSARSGRPLDNTRLTELAAQGDEVANAVLVSYENRLARGLAGLINILNPHAIVLGGGISNIDRLYDNVPRLWGKYVFSDVVGTRLLKAKHGDSSGVRGAAWLHDD